MSMAAPIDPPADPPVLALDAFLPYLVNVLAGRLSRPASTLTR